MEKGSINEKELVSEKDKILNDILNKEIVDISQ